MSVSACFLQHIEDASEIQELGKYKPHVLLTQENTQIKELQQENKGKKSCLLLTTSVELFLYQSFGTLVPNLLALQTCGCLLKSTSTL